MEKDIKSLVDSGDVLFMLLGAIMVFAMHGGFAFLEVGTVRKKNTGKTYIVNLIEKEILSSR